MGNFGILKKKQQLSTYKLENDLYGFFVQLSDIDEQCFIFLFDLLKEDKIKDTLGFLSKEGNQKIEKELLQNQSIFYKEINKYEQNKIMKIIHLIKIMRDHDFNKQNYSLEEYKEVKQDLIIKIFRDKRIIAFLLFLVHLTALDEGYIQCGSNSLHLLVKMKIELKEKCFENIKIRNTSLLGANFVGCDFSGSEFENVIISGVNLNGAKLVNCKWKNLGIHEGIEFKGHGDQINSICFSPDGMSLASCSQDNSIRLWDVKTGKMKSVLKEGREIKQVCFSLNGTTLAFCKSIYVYLWNIRTRKYLIKLMGHQNDVYSVCFSPDSTMLASSGRDMTIYLWNVKTLQKAKFKGYVSSVQSVCFSPDGTILASSSLDKSICLWDVKTSQQKVKLEGHQFSVNSFCFSPDGTKLAFGSWGEPIYLRDVKKIQQKVKLDGHTHYIRSVCFSPDGTTLATGSYNKYIHLWDVKTGQQKAKLEGHDRCVISVCFSPDGTILASCGQDKSIRLWDVRINQQILLTEYSYKDIPVKFKSLVFLKSVNSKCQIQQNSQNPNLQAYGALILKGEFINYQGRDLRQFFQSKGACISRSQI